MQKSKSFGFKTTAETDGRDGRMDGLDCINVLANAAINRKSNVDVVIDRHGNIFAERRQYDKHCSALKQAVRQSLIDGRRSCRYSD